MTAYTCQECSKVFTEKRSLTRHVKTIHKNEVYQCETCERKFKRRDNLKRHQLIHKKIVCQKCKKNFQNEEELKSHQKSCCVCPSCRKEMSNEEEFKQHDCFAAIPTVCAGINEPPIKKRKSLKIKRPNKNQENASEKPVEEKEKDPSVEEVTNRHWQSIRNFIRKGKIQSIFNFRYNKDFKLLINEIVDAIMQCQKTRFKINCSLAYILRNIETNQLRYFHSSYNNHQLLERALLISNRQELVKFLNNLSEEKFHEALSRPDTKWKIVEISNLTFFVNHLQDVPLGAPSPLPPYIVNNRGLVNVSADNNLCFFRCLAIFQGADRRRCETKTKELFREYCSKNGIKCDNFFGVTLFDFVKLEDFFKINIIAYELGEKTACLLQRSRELYIDTMRINVHKNHCSLIINFDVYCHVFKCIHCSKLWYKDCKFYRHTKTCTNSIREIYPGGVYKNPTSIFERLEEIGIVVPKTDRHYPFYACFDFESYFSKDDLPKNRKKLSFEARHIPLSVGIASNVPGFEKGKCFLSDGDEAELVKKLILYLEEISLACYQILEQKFSYVFSQLECSTSNRKELLLKEFQNYCMELICIGFNSSSYDLNLIKPTLIQQLLNKIQFVIKRANTYLCIKTNSLQFLDIRHFLAPGFSYRKFLIAYKSDCQKFFFPYEFVTGLNKLNSGLPDHESFYSSLNRSNITEEEYDFVKKTWLEKGWKTLKNMLIYYNLLDCEPFVQAVSNLLTPYLNQGLDIFKTSFSVSGVAKFQMLKQIEENAFFCLFPKRHSDLYKTLREQLTGGLSIVFTRLAVANETKIRPHEISNPETVQHVLGLDANSLYLHAISQNNPTGYFCRYRLADNFRPDPCSRFGLQSYQWLSYIQKLENRFLQTRFNKGERRVSSHSYPVDGFCEKTNTCYQYLGCFWHSCQECNTNKNSDGTLQITHPVKKKTHQEIRKETIEVRKNLEKEGFRVVEIRECEWLKKRKQPEVLKLIKDLRTVQPKHQLTFEKILDGVQKDTLFGFLIVDIHTPDHLKEYLKDFPPIVKNSMVSRDDIGEYMRNVAEEHKLLEKPQKYLISSYFGKEILINTEMAKFYMELGLKITKIKEFIEFCPQKCFSKLANNIVDSRRSADVDKSKAIIALTNKLTGNSLYSASLLNKEKHRNITYHSNETVNDIINEPYFVHLDQILPDLYEVKSLKHTIKHDLPIQIGLNVYLNSKLHMLKFFYLFLKKFIPDRCFELLESDTDSMYFCISRPSLDDCVPEKVKTEYFKQKLVWMPSEACKNHETDYIKCRVAGKHWEMPECCAQFHKYEQRTLGKMKVEFSGSSQVCLSSKTYFCVGPQNKQICKGVSIQQNPLTFEQYQHTLQTNEPLEIVNKGFRTHKHNVFSYAQSKKGLNSFYPKRIVLNDGIHTKPLDI